MKTLEYLKGQVVHNNSNGDSYGKFTLNPYDKVGEYSKWSDFCNGYSDAYRESLEYELNHRYPM